jgi:hypothetical protein
MWSDRGALGEAHPARSETQSEVHCERDGVGSRRAYRPTETDWQVCLDEVRFEQAVVLDGPAFVNQGRKSPRRVIYIERQSSSHRPAVSQTVYKTGMNSESSLPCPRCIYLGDKFEVEGQATATLDGDSNRKSNRRRVCQIGDVA